MRSVRYLTLHLDEEAKYHLKSYFLFVHNVPHIFRNLEEKEKSKRNAMDSEAPEVLEVLLNTDIMNRRWTLVCTDTMSPRGVAAVMRKLFKEFQLLFSCGEYVQG